MNRVLIFVLSIHTFVSSCSRTTPSKEETAKEVVKTWLGKTIQLPPDVTPSIHGITPVNNFSVPKPFKILVYVDSAGCTSCSLRIDLWKNYIEEANSKMAGKVDFMFYFNPKKFDVVPDMLKHEDFTYPVYLDNRDRLNKINNLPTVMMYQSFLLDSENKVLLVGNPTLRTSIWDLYKKQIQGELVMKKAQ